MESHYTVRVCTGKNITKISHSHSREFEREQAIVPIQIPMNGNVEQSPVMGAYIFPFLNSRPIYIFHVLDLKEGTVESYLYYRSV